MEAIIIYFSLVSQYGPGMMEMVIENRQNGNAWVSLPLDLPAVDGYIAMCDCGLLEEIVWIRSPLGGVWEKHLVVDCCFPGDGTKEWMEKNDIFCEVSHETATRWNIVGKGLQVEWSMDYPLDKVRLEP